MSSSPTAKFVDMDADLARKVVGFRDDLKEGEKGFRYINSDGIPKKFVLDKNKANRPFRLRDAEDYAVQVFEGTWVGGVNHPSKTASGDAWQIGWDGFVISCAHRAVAVILAQCRRDAMKKFGQTDLLEEFNVPEKISIPVLLVEGLDPAAADTTDIPILRTMGDVFFRHGVFTDKDLSDSQKAKLTRDLAAGVRLVWVRLRGETETSGSELTFPNALKFQEERHPLILDCLKHVFAENSGDDHKGKISDYVSLGKAAGLMYLMAFSGTSRQELEEDKVNMTRRPALMDKAEKFWTFFSQFKSKGLTAKDSPEVAALHSSLDKNRKSKGDKLHRDDLSVLVARAWASFSGQSENKITTAAQLEKGLYKKAKNAKGEDIQVLDHSTLRFGGIDVDREVLIENNWIAREEELTRKVVDGWKLKDLVWVNQPGGKVAPWFGSVVEFEPTGKKVIVEDKSEDSKFTDAQKSDPEVNLYNTDNQCFECEVAWLCVEKPEEPKEEKKPEEKKPEEKKAAAKGASKKPPTKKPPTKQAPVAAAK